MVTKSAKERLPIKAALKFLLYTAGFNALIAIFLTGIKFGGGLGINFIISQSIGLSICSCVMIAHRFFDNAGPVAKAFLMAAALIVGSIGGFYLGAFASGMRTDILLERHSLLQLLFLGVMFGSIITYFFSSREQIAESQARIQEEQIKRLISEKKAAEANLRLLQAQIEPHFLFNTLSNVLSLLDTNPALGKNMLVDFIQYLRGSLSQIRQAHATLGQEMEMIRAYLGIYQIRMGKRLKFKMDLPAHLKTIAFPPMLIQPLVENAIQHGLEPKIDGGEIFISGNEKDGMLRLEIRDTGLGFDADREPSGMGLNNIRERLQALYGENGRLILEENQPHGVKATIEVPHGKP